MQQSHFVRGDEIKPTNLPSCRPFQVAGVKYESQMNQQRVRRRKLSPKCAAGAIAKPKRPLTAYNIFFRAERAKMVATKSEASVQGNNPRSTDRNSRDKKKRAYDESNDKSGFRQMARYIGEKWKKLDEPARSFFHEQAAQDLKRYRKDMEIYRQTVHVVSGNMAKVTQKQTMQPQKALPHPATTPPLQNCPNVSKICERNKPPLRVECQSALDAALGICDIAFHPFDQNVVGSCDISQKQYFQERPRYTRQRSMGELENDLRLTLGDDIITCLSNLQDDSSQARATTAGQVKYQYFPHTNPFPDVVESYEFEPLDPNLCSSTDDWTDKLGLMANLQHLNENETPEAHRRIRRRSNVF